MALAPVGISASVTGVRQFNSALTSMTSNLHKFGAAAKGLEGVGRQVSTAMGSAAAATNRASTANTKATNTTANLAKRFGQSANAARSFGFGLQQVGFAARQLGVTLSVLISAPLALGFTLATKEAINFETELTKLRTLAGVPAEIAQATGDAILGLGENVNGLGLAIETGIGPTELATAAYFIYSAGVKDAALANSILEVAAKGSAIGLGETADVADALTSVINAYGSENITAARAADILLASVDEGKFEADQFADSIGKTLGILANLGVSFEEAGAFVALFSRVGTTASESFTGLRRALLAIQKPSGSAEDAFTAVSTSTERLLESIRDRGLFSTLQELRRRLDDAGIGLEQVFTRETGLNAVLLLTSEEVAPAYKDALGEIINSNGLLEQSFAITQATTGFQLQQLVSSFKVLGITIASAVLPAINRLVQLLLPLVKVIANFASEHPRVMLMVAALAALAAAVGPLILVMGVVIGVIGSFVGAFGSLLTIIAAATAAGGFTVLAASALSAAAPILLIVGAIALVVTAIGALIAAIAIGVTAGFQHLQKSGEDVGGFFDDLAQRAFNWGRNIVIQLARGIIQSVIFVVNAIASLGRAIAGLLAPGSPPALLPDLPSWGESAMSEWVKGFANADFSTFADIASVIESFLRSGAMEEDVSLIPNILGVRDSIAAIIAQIRTMGNVSSEAIRNMVAGIGLANVDLENYVATMIELAQASERVKEIQEEIAAVNESFDSILAPLNEEVEAIRDRRREFEQQEELAGIAEALADPDLTAQERAILLDRQRELVLLDQIDAQEDLRDEQIAALEEQLAAAEAEQQRLQDQADAQKALIDLQTEHNDLLREQMELLKSLTEELKDLGGAAPAAGDEIIPDFGEFGAPELDFGEDPLGLEEVAANAEAAMENLETELGSILDELTGPINNLKTAWENLGAAWAPVVQEIIDGTIFTTAKERIDEFIAGIPGSSQLGALVRNFGVKLRDTFSSGVALATSLAQGDFATAGQNLGTFILNALSAMWAHAELVVGALAGLLVAIGNWVLSVDWGALFTQALQAISDFFGGLWIILSPRFEELITSIRTWVDARYAQFKEIAGNAATALKDGILTLWEKVQPFFSPTGFIEQVRTKLLGLSWYDIGFSVATFVLNGLHSIGNFVLVTLPEWIGDVISWGTDSQQTLKDFGKNMVINIFEGLRTLLDWITDTEQGLPRFLLDFDQWLRDKALDFIDLGITAAENIIQGIKDTITNALPNLILAIVGLAQGIIDAWNEFWGSHSLNPPPAGGSPGAPGGQIGDPGTPGTNAAPRGGFGGFGGMAGLSSIVAAPAPIAAPTVISNQINMVFHTTVGSPAEENRFRAMIRQEVERALAVRSR